MATRFPRDLGRWENLMMAMFVLEDNFNRGLTGTIFIFTGEYADGTAQYPSWGNPGMSVAVCLLPGRSESDIKEMLTNF